jgi:cytochrome c oxidase subunit II
MMQWIIQEASSYAGDIDNLILVVAVLGGFWLILAEAVLFYFMFRYSRSRNPKAQYITGELKHEKKWIHIPHNLVLLCDVVIVVLAIKVWYNVKQVQPPADDTIRIVGHQWAWEFHNAPPGGQLGKDDISTVDELHVEVNKNIIFKLEAADVIHSFSVPVFRLKQDAMPGRVITGWFRPTKTGVFDIQCTQICGLGHGIMGARIYVETADQHRAWLDKMTKKG